MIKNAVIAALSGLVVMLFVVCCSLRSELDWEKALHREDKGGGRC